MAEHSPIYCPVLPVAREEGAMTEEDQSRVVGRQFHAPRDGDLPHPRPVVLPSYDEADDEWTDADEEYFRSGARYPGQ